jgi:benzodiazapine receptor
MDTASTQWYKGIRKSELTPPNWVFSVVWPILYITLAIVLVILLTDRRCAAPWLCQPLWFFLIQMVLNLSWTTIFFQQRAPRLALGVLVTIWLFTVFTLISLWDFERTAYWIMLPYFVWISFALYLNAVIVWLNPISPSKN